MKYETSVTLPISARDYFIEKDSAPFLALMARMQKLKDMRLLDVRQDGDADVLHFLTVPDMDAYVPPALMRFVAADPGVHDYLRYNRARVAGPTYSWSVESNVPGLGGDKFSNVYDVTVEPVDGERCKQTISGNVRIKIFGVGGTAERITVDSIVSAYSAMEQVLQRWLEFKKQVLAAPGGVEALMEGRPDLSVIPKDALDLLNEPYTQPTPLLHSSTGLRHSEEEEEEDAFHDAAETLECPETWDEATCEAALADLEAILQSLPPPAAAQPAPATPAPATPARAAAATGGEDGDPSPGRSFSAALAWFESLPCGEAFSTRAAKDMADVREARHKAFQQWRALFDSVPVAEPEELRSSERVRAFFDTLYLKALRQPSDATIQGMSKAKHKSKGALKAYGHQVKSDYLKVTKGMSGLMRSALPSRSSSGSGSHEPLQ